MRRRRDNRSCVKKTRLPMRLRILLPAVTFLLGWEATMLFLGKPVFVAGASMFPTLKDGDCVLQMRCLPWSALARGDVVVLNDGQGKAVKRIIGLPGEHIRLSGGRVLVNNFLLHEPYLPIATPTIPSTKGTSFVLGESQYFVLGDNRVESFDSRDYGPVKVSRIVGSVDVDRHQPVRYAFKPAATVHAQEHE